MPKSSSSSKSGREQLRMRSEIKSNSSSRWISTMRTRTDLNDGMLNRWQSGSFDAYVTCFDLASALATIDARKQQRIILSHPPFHHASSAPSPASPRTRAPLPVNGMGRSPSSNPHRHFVCGYIVQTRQLISIASILISFRVRHPSQCNPSSAGAGTAGMAPVVRLCHVHDRAVMIELCAEACMRRLLELTSVH